ncbi:hypothetical protein AX17_003926 [Amanita inopinata Kibby_2008]|nr:hypothetical protein AX17_003926 [Amanita inopinata Kibby_2008]
MSSAATAIASTVTKSKPNIIPPASPFAELLRRSRFASYDPAIRQAYSSPSAHAHRGDWGLKRPIALRRRNAFISLASFESPAQFTEWNHAENQVRFIRRIEEMGVTPRVSSDSSWYRGLGKAKIEWSTDSDFCPGEGHELVLGPENRSRIGTDLAGLGNKGTRQYGAHRPLPQPPQKDRPSTSHVIPNLNAMSRKEFHRYLRKLRHLRPKFQEYLQKQNMTADKSLYELAQDSSSDQHTQFLLNHTSEEFNSRTSRQIEQQPHPNAGLMYASPSRLDTRLTTRALPGIILQAEDKHFQFHKFERPDERCIVSFGGLSATVERKGIIGKNPLFKPGTEQGIDKSKLEESVGKMRLADLELVVPPRVVGRRAQGLKAIRVKAQVTVASTHHEFGVDNPHEPGTPDYIAAPERGKQLKPAYWTRRNAKFTPIDTHAPWEVAARSAQQEKTDKVIGTLGGIVGDAKERVSDEDL